MNSDPETEIPVDVSIARLRAAHDRLRLAKVGWTKAASAVLHQEPGARDLVDPALEELAAARKELQELGA